MISKRFFFQGITKRMGNIIGGDSSSGPAVTSVFGKYGKAATSIFDFDVENNDGTTVSLDSFKGKKMYYVVNVASQ